MLDMLLAVDKGITDIFSTSAVEQRLGSLRYFWLFIAGPNPHTISSHALRFTEKYNIWSQVNVIEHM